MKVYTQAELEGMSNLELNSMAASCFGVLNPTITDGKLVGAIKRVGVININAHIDYCNNWSDCGELIDESGIIADGYGFAEGVSDDDRQYRVKCNVKRAVTIVYILIKQGE